MELDSETLAVSLEDEFPDAKISVFTEEDSVMIRESPAPAGMYYPEDYDRFVEKVELFVMQYTKEWIVKNTNMNRIEGEHSAILSKKS